MILLFYLVLLSIMFCMMNVHDVVRDIVFNTSYGDEGVVRARETLVSILNKLSLAQNIEILP